MRFSFSDIMNENFVYVKLKYNILFVFIYDKGRFPGFNEGIPGNLYVCRSEDPK